MFKAYRIVPLAVVFFILLSTGCEDGQNMLAQVKQPGQTPLTAQTYTYLGLKPSTDENTITPTNDFSDWGLRNYIHEKTPEGSYYSLLIDDDPALDALEQEWIILDTIDHKFDRDFDHWIYLHGRSEVVYNLSNSRFEKFEGYIAAADIWGKSTPGCGHGGTIKFIFFVDDITVYKSGVIVGRDQNEPIHVQFEIPDNSQTLTIIVTDARDGIGCDHWTLGNPRLLHKLATP